MRNIQKEIETKYGPIRVEATEKRYRVIVLGEKPIKINGVEYSGVYSYNRRTNKTEQSFSWLIRPGTNKDATPSAFAAFECLAEVTISSFQSDYPEAYARMILRDLHIQKEKLSEERREVKERLDDIDMRLSNLHGPIHSTAKEVERYSRDEKKKAE